MPLDRAGGFGGGLTVQVYMDGATYPGGDDFRAVHRGDGWIAPSGVGYSAREGLKLKDKT